MNKPTPIVAASPLTTDELHELARAICRANRERPTDSLARQARNRLQAYTNLLDPVYEMEPTFPRAWHIREQESRSLHPAVIAACEITRPHDWHQLVLEWPHVSTDRERVAYTQDDKKGDADRQTVTSLGKYMARHWKGLLNDNVLRDIAKRFTATGMRITNDAAEIIRSVQEGPKSCMKWDQDDVDRAGGHPYEAYCPDLGWAVCIREEAGVIVGRALLLTQNGRIGFVRSFYNDGSDSYSHSDDTMEAWLTGQGIEKWQSWPSGARLAKVTGAGRTQNGYLLPYLDGCRDRVDSDGLYWRVSSSGAWTCDNTDGNASGGVECDDCGDHAHEDEMTSVGYHGDRQVCDCCIDDYTSVTGRRGNTYYVRNDDAVSVDGEHYDREYLSENNIVELADGDYVHIDDAYHCAVRDEWYHTDDMRFAEDLDDYVHMDEAWQCAATEKWYSSEIDPVVVDGEDFHPDHAPEEDEDTDEHIAETQDLIARHGAALAACQAALQGVPA